MSGRSALAVEERQHRTAERRCDAHLIVSEVGQDREAVLRHVLAAPAGVLQAAAQQVVELDEARNDEA